MSAVFIDKGPPVLRGGQSVSGYRDLRIQWDSSQAGANSRGVGRYDMSAKRAFCPDDLVLGRREACRS